MSKEVPGLSTVGLKMDMIRFQDEILRDMRQMQGKLDAKYMKADEILNESLTKYQIKIELLEKKISDLSNLIINDNSLKGKIETLFKFKEETEDTIFKRRAKFAELEKKFNDDIDNINKILTNTVIYPAIIGKTAKFKTFHEFVDFCVQEINKLNILKNKGGVDITPFKKKVESDLEIFKIQIANLTPKQITEQMVHDMEERINSSIKIFNDRLEDTRVENSHYSFGIKKKAEEMEKQMENLNKMQKFINKKLESFQNFEIFNSINNEIMTINQKINRILDILRELGSFHPEVKKKYHELEKKPVKKIISGVKQYIKGNLNANELASMKKFAFEKTKTKAFDLGSLNLNLKTIQSIPSSPDNLLINNLVPKRKSIFMEPRSISIGEDKVNKKFMSKKTVNLSNQVDTLDTLTQKLEKDKIIRSNLNRKKTYSFGIKPNYESSKNNYEKKTSYANIYFENQKHNIIEEENELNNASNNSNNSITDNNNNKIDSENNYQTSIENDKSKNAIANKIINDNLIKADNYIEDKKDIEKNEINEKEERNTNIKNEVSINENKIKEEKSDIDENLNIKENNLNINNNDIKSINKKESIEKKVSLINIKTNINQNNLKNEDIKKAKEINIKKNISQEENNKNKFTKNNNTSNASLSKELKSQEKEKNESNKKALTLDQSNNKNKTIKNTSITPKLNLQTSDGQDSPSSELSEKNKELKTYNSNGNTVLIPINYNFKSKNPEITMVSIRKKLYKTFSNFPKITTDFSDNKIKFSQDSRDKYTKTINEDKLILKESNITSALKQPKKILLMNPDNLPQNYFDKAYKDIMKNNIYGNKSDRGNNNNKYKEINSFSWKKEHKINDTEA